VGTTAAALWNRLILVSPSDARRPQPVSILLSHLTSY